MSEANRAAATSIEMKAKEKEKKDKREDTAAQDGPDPYCCTPGGGTTGPDTKP